MRLNLGCGHQILDGWINLDRSDFGQQVVRDVTRGLPFSDGTFDEILADNLLEHIPPGDDSVFVMNEIYRVCKPGAKVTVIVPHAFSQGAHQDPTHCNYFVPRSALYWNQDLPWPAMYGSTCDFDVSKIEVYGDQEKELFIRFELTARAK